LDFGFWILDLELRVQGVGLRVLGLGLRVKYLKALRVRG
jgi:hypothetical protein